MFLSLDLDPERDGITWDGRLGVGLFGDAGDRLLVMDDANAVSPNSEATLLTVKYAGTYYAYVDSAQVPPADVTGTYHLSVSVHPATPIGVHCVTYDSGPVNLAIGPGGPAGVPTDSTIVVPGIPRIEDVNLSVVLTHPQMADIDATLLSPAGNENSVFRDLIVAQTQMDNDFDDEAAPAPGFSRGISLQPGSSELKYKLSWFKGENGGGPWTLRLRDDGPISSSGKLLSWALTICEPPPPPVCFGIPVTVYASDFEADGGGFTHSGVLDQWARGLPVNNPIGNPITTCNSGVNCWKTNLFGVYANNSNQTLRSPGLSLAGLGAPIEVTWAQRYQMENANTDSMSAEVQEPGTLNPRTLFQWMDSTMSDVVGYNGLHLEESAGWGLVRRSLDDYANKTIQLRWNVTTNNTGQLSGLAVDDVTVTACCTAASCADGDPCTDDVCSHFGCAHVNTTTPGPSPGEVTGVAFAADKITMSWPSVPDATLFDLVRGDLSALPMGSGGEYEGCVEGIAGTAFGDGSIPATEQGFWYVVRGANTCSPPGTWGNATSGPRSTTVCP